MTEIVLTASLCIVYLIIIRFIDLNEREPLWAVLLLFGLGFIAASCLGAALPRGRIAFDTFGGAAVQESLKFVAILVGLTILSTVGRVRGWSELNGPMDGIVYGTAAGLGFATGDTLARVLFLSAGPSGPLEPSLSSVFWISALDGLAHGVFGALSGSSLIMAFRARPGSAVLWVAAGPISATLANACLRSLAYGNALGGTTALVRVWLALSLPLVVIVAIGIYALEREREAILDELSEETTGGLVTREDLSLLAASFRRQATYWACMARGDFARAAILHGLHTRQVQLALIKRRARESPDDDRRRRAIAEAERLRESLRAQRERWRSLVTSPADGPPT